MWPFKSDPAKKVTSEGAITSDVVVRALTALHGDGAHFALYYANMNGYHRETIDAEHILQFINASEGEPAFTSSGMEYAVRRLIESTTVICGLDSFDSFAFGFQGDKNLEHRADLYALKSAVSGEGCASLFGRVGFNPAAWLAEITTQRRTADLEVVIEKLEQRRLYLKPLLLGAKARGRNKYGEVDWEEYVRELSDFIKYYFPDGALLFFYGRPPVSYCLRYIELWFAEPGNDSLIPTDGIDFEHWCANQLQAQGWAARVSKATGDQGVDIEAIKPGLTVAIQCKRYAQPITNKAVQEAYAGMVHYGANVACVIGVGGFTASAQALARSTGVVLLDAENIAEFDDLIRAIA